jgi:hypothetical protein
MKTSTSSVMSAFSTLQLTQSRGAEDSSIPADGIDYPAGVGKLLPGKLGLTIPLSYRLGSAP